MATPNKNVSGAPNLPIITTAVTGPAPASPPPGDGDAAPPPSDLTPEQLAAFTRAPGQPQADFEAGNLPHDERVAIAAKVKAEQQEAAKNAGAPPVIKDFVPNPPTKRAPGQPQEDFAMQSRPHGERVAHAQQKNDDAAEAKRIRQAAMKAAIKKGEVFQEPPGTPYPSEPQLGQPRESWEHGGLPHAERIAKAKEISAAQKAAKGKPRTATRNPFPAALDFPTAKEILSGHDFARHIAVLKKFTNDAQDCEAEILRLDGLEAGMLKEQIDLKAIVGRMGISDITPGKENLADINQRAVGDLQQIDIKLPLLRQVRGKQQRLLQTALNLLPPTCHNLIGACAVEARARMDALAEEVAEVAVDHTGGHAPSVKSVTGHWIENSNPAAWNAIWTLPGAGLLNLNADNVILLVTMVYRFLADLPAGRPADQPLVSRNFPI